MDAYEPEKWHETFLMLGSSMAVLSGLLFVAVSIQVAAIARMPHWRVRAFNNVFAFIGLFVEATCVLVPQGRVALGIELILVNLFLLYFVPVRGLIDLSRLGGTLPKLRLVSGMVAWALGALGGLSLIVEVGGGLYLVTVSSLALVWLAILNGWSVMTIEGPSDGSAAT
jgi:modulator of FtsH protease